MRTFSGNLVDSKTDRLAQRTLGTRVHLMRGPCLLNSQSASGSRHVLAFARLFLSVPSSAVEASASGQNWSSASTARAVLSEVSGALISKLPRPQPWVPMRGDPAAIHHESGAGHVGGIGRSQERDGCADLFGLSNSSQSCSCFAISQFVGNVLDAAKGGCVNGSRAHRIASDAFQSVVDGNRAGELQDCCFGGAIGCSFAERIDCHRSS